METIELKLSLSKEQFDMICCGLKALADSMSAIMADNMADKVADTKPSSNTYIDTNTSTDTNTYKDYKTRVDSLITSLASNTKLDTNTNANNSTRMTTASNNKNNNNIINVVDEKANIVVNENTNTCIDNGIPSYEDVLAYVNTCKYSMSAQKFFDYYQKMGWKTKNGVSLERRWKGFVDTWAKAEFTKPQAATPKGNQAGMGTVEERHATHPFVPSFDT